MPLKFCAQGKCLACLTLTQALPLRSRLKLQGRAAPPGPRLPRCPHGLLGLLLSQRLLGVGVLGGTQELRCFSFGSPEPILCVCVGSSATLLCLGISGEGWTGERSVETRQPLSSRMGVGNGDLDGGCRLRRMFSPSLLSDLPCCTLYQA